jgi:multicomponent Na+:H+ antiporter subunit E
MIIGFGVASCAFVVWLSLRMDIVDDEGEPTAIALGLIGYVPWLLLEIAKANIHVARVIWSPTMPLRRRLFSVPTSQASELGNAIYANSITLTPGTVALDVRRDTILVHALTQDSQEGLETGDMDRRVTRLEGGGGSA